MSITNESPQGQEVTPKQEREFVATELEKYRPNQKNYPQAFLAYYQKAHSTDFGELKTLLEKNQCSERLELAIDELDQSLDQYFEDRKVAARAVVENTPEAYDAFLEHNGLPKLVELQADVQAKLAQKGLSRDLAIPNGPITDIDSGSEYGLNDYQVRVEYQDNGTVQVTLKGAPAMSDEARELYNEYVQGAQQLLQKIPGYKVGRGLTTSQREQGLVAITVGLPKIATDEATKEELVKSGYLVRTEDGRITHREGYEWVNPNDKGDFAVRKVAPAGAAPATREAAPKAPIDYRADARKNPKDYLTEAAGDVTFNPPNREAEMAIRIEDLYDDSDKPKLTSTKYPGLIFAYGEGKDGKSWYDIDGSGKRLAISKGDTLKRVKEEPVPSPEPIPTPPVVAEVKAPAVDFMDEGELKSTALTLKNNREVLTKVLPRQRAELVAKKGKLFTNDNKIDADIAKVDKEIDTYSRSVTTLIGDLTEQKDNPTYAVVMNEVFDKDTRTALKLPEPTSSALAAGPADVDPEVAEPMAGDLPPTSNVG